MSKSLEALDKLCDLATQDGDCLNYVIGISGIIKQDLERLELIETFYNKSLKELETIKNDDRELYLKYQAFINEKEQLKNDIKLNETQIDDLTLEVANYKHALEEKNEIIMDLKEDLRLTTIERTNCEDIWEEEHQKCCKLEKENKELKDKLSAIEFWNERYIEHNEKLEKALDKACERLEWDCPVSQELIDDLDCEHCKDDYKGCWKKYFLKEVLE